MIVVEKKPSDVAFLNMFSKENAKKELEKDKAKKERIAKATKAKVEKSMRNFELMECRKISDYIDKTSHTH